MVSTWRYYSFKGISLSKPYTPLIVIVVGAFIYLTWNWPQPVLLAMRFCLRGQRHSDPHRRTHSPAPSPTSAATDTRSRSRFMKTIALIGSDTLLGREIRDILATTEADIDLRLIADTQEVRRLAHPRGR